MRYLQILLCLTILFVRSTIAGERPATAPPVSRDINQRILTLEKELAALRAQLQAQCPCPQGPCICIPATCQCDGCSKHKTAPNRKSRPVPSGLESQDEYFRNRDVGGYSRATVPVKRSVMVFTATWCKPCENWKAAELPQLRAAGVPMERFEFIDADRSPEVLREFDIKFLPTFLFVDGDTITQRYRGYVTAETVHRFLN